MEKKGIIILMGVIIIILAVLCVLFATGTITFNNKVTNNLYQNSMKDKSKNRTSQQENENNDLDNGDGIGKTVNNIYYGYFMKKDYSTILVLYNNNSFQKCDKYECLSGGYTLNNNELNLVTDSTEEYPTRMKYTYTLSKSNDENELISNNSNEYVNLKEISKKDVEKVYYGYFSSNNISYSTGLILYKDSTFLKCDRYECLGGKYTLNDNKLSLVTSSNEENPISIEYDYVISSKDGENVLNSLKPNEYVSLKELN